MNNELIIEILEKHLVPHQDYIYGLADLVGIIDKSFGEFQFGISIGKKLNCWGFKGYCYRFNFSRRLTTDD